MLPFHLIYQIHKQLKYDDRKNLEQALGINSIVHHLARESTFHLAFIGTKDGSDKFRRRIPIQDTDKTLVVLNNGDYLIECGHFIDYETTFDYRGNFKKSYMWKYFSPRHRPIGYSAQKIDELAYNYIKGIKTPERRF